MAPYLPPPEPSTLLPPLLACLATAFAFSQPPPTLLPLLSPILRQRVRLLSGSEDGSSSRSSWLLLLCWEPSQGPELSSVIKSHDFEPHPVSGEIEVEDVEPMYKRLDEETLQSVLDMDDMELRAIYVWCAGGGSEGEAPGWRLSELRPLKALPSGDKLSWSRSISEAGEMFKLRRDSAIQVHERPATRSPAWSGNRTASVGQDDGEDGYWAMYDNAPSGTPAPTGAKPAPIDRTNGRFDRQASTSEADYYAKYGGVQPALDYDDPSTDKRIIGETTLHGNGIAGTNGNTIPSAETAIMNGAIFSEEQASVNEGLVHTRPSSSSSSSSSSAIAHLEKTASNQSQAEFAIQQHISTTLKSLFRLARGAGISRSEFDRLVNTELEVLSILEEDDD